MEPTARRTLGRTGVEVTALGFGCAPLGSMLASVSDEQAASALEEAWARGVRYFDTAPLYGLGLAERRLGHMLQTKPRDEFVVSTKVGRLLRDGDPKTSPNDVAAWVDSPGRIYDFDFSYDGVTRSLDESLLRLGLDRVDVLLVHDPDDHHDAALDGAFKALQHLRADGTVRAIGAGMNQVEMLTRFADEVDVDCFLVAGRYTLLEQPALAELFPLCEERGIAVIAGGVFNSGLLADPKPGITYNYAPAPPELIERARELASVCERYGVPLKAAALQFPLRHPVVATVLTGARMPDEIEENARLFATTIPDALWRDLEEVDAGP